MVEKKEIKQRARIVVKSTNLVRELNSVSKLQAEKLSASEVMRLLGTEFVNKKN